MKTIQKPLEQTTTDNLTGLREKVEQIKKETPQTRKVTLVYSSCCGCGCSDVKVSRIVPYDSTYKDGDRVKKLEDTDKFL